MSWSPAFLRRSAADPVARAVIALTAAMALVLVPGVPALVRAPVAVTFFLLAPGLAWVRSLPANGPVERAGVVVAVSLAVDVVVAEAFVYAGISGVGPVLTLLVAVVLLGLWCTTRRGPGAVGDARQAPAAVPERRRAAGSTEVSR